MTRPNSRLWYEHRPSDHRAGMRGYWHGPIVPMQPEPRGLFARLLGRK